MEEKILAEAQALIRQSFELEGADESMTEEQLLDLLSDQVAYWITQKIEFLFSLMYRLDIDESKVEAALHPNAPEPANVGIAKLILARQKQRAYTKINYPPLPLGDEWRL